MNAIRKFEQQGARWIIQFAEPNAQNRSDAVRLLKEQGCTWFKHLERYDITDDSMILETIGQ